MSSLVFSPKFVIEKLLGISFNRLQVNHLKETTGLSERTIYYWFELGRIPKRSVFLSLMEKYAQGLEGRCEGIAFPINSTEFIRALKDPDWNSFALNELQFNPDYFPRVLNNIRRNIALNIEECVGDGDLRKLGNCLPTELLRNLHSVKADGEDAESDGEARGDLIEVVAVIFYLAFLEAEYFADIGREDSFLEKVLPTYADREKGVINMPVELFFQNLLKNLIENGFFASKRAIAEEIEDWMNLESTGGAYREINRYLNESKIPSWKTFNEWLPQLIPKEYQGETVDKEVQLVYVQNLFGAGRILDKTFRLFIQRLYQHAGKRSVDFFTDIYAHYSKKLVEELSQDGPSSPP